VVPPHEDKDSITCAGAGESVSSAGPAVKQLWPGLHPRVRTVMEELRVEYPEQPFACLRALAELYVAAERLSDWVSARADAGISPGGSVAPAALEARRAWATYLEKAGDVAPGGCGRRRHAPLSSGAQRESRLARHVRGED
jgi:hypothetical protein